MARFAVVARPIATGGLRLLNRLDASRIGDANEFSDPPLVTFEWYWHSRHGVQIAMLDANLKSQLRLHFQNIRRPVEIVASLDDSAKSSELTTLLKETAELTDQITILETQDGDERKPSFSIRQQGKQSGIRFAASPTGPEFSSLVLALLHVGGHPIRANRRAIEQLETLKDDYYFETYISLSCRSCVEVVQALNMMAVVNPRIHHVMIDGGLFQNEVNERHITVVPTMYLNGELFGEGRQTFDELAGRLSDIEASVIAALRAARMR